MLPQVRGGRERSRGRTNFHWFQKRRHCQCLAGPRVSRRVRDGLRMLVAERPTPSHLVRR